MSTSTRGFNSMSNDNKKRIASMGGKEAHRLGVGHEFTTEEAIATGRKGGLTISKDRAHMVMIGRRGGSAKKTKKVKLSDNFY